MVKEKVKAKKKSVIRPVSKGAGMTAGLEIWCSSSGSFVLVDSSPDDRFAHDVEQWNLNAGYPKKYKDAAK